jgi:anti-sigma regulatory factor (Ser/Thr protein kinase)
MATSTSSASPLKSPAGRTRRSLRLSIAGGPHAPQRARAWLQSAAAWLPDELESNLLLLTCELVNNSVVHGHADEGDLIEIELRATASGVRAQVSDPGPGFAPSGRERSIDEPGGWGLVLVDSISASWGVERGERTNVWFELAA